MHMKKIKTFHTHVNFWVFAWSFKLLLLDRMQAHIYLVIMKTNNILFGGKAYVKATSIGTEKMLQKYKTVF